MEEREKLVQEFVKNRAELKRRQVDFKVSRQHEGEFFERASEPIVNAEKSVAEAINKKQDKEIEGLQEVTQAVEDTQQQLAQRLDDLVLLTKDKPSWKAIENSNLLDRLEAGEYINDIDFEILGKSIGPSTRRTASPADRELCKKTSNVTMF